MIGPTTKTFSLGLPTNIIIKRLALRFLMSVCFVSYVIVWLLGVTCNQLPFSTWAILAKRFLARIMLESLQNCSAIVRRLDAIKLLIEMPTNNYHEC